jgi:D-sedoheptulose 7-phosphate isomerase
MNAFSDIISEHLQILNSCREMFRQSFPAAVAVCGEALGKGGKLLICGNGGSAADAQHFAAELVGRFEKERKPWPAICLATDSSVMTALSNDYGFQDCFSRQVEALGRPGDVLIALSTSGASENVITAAESAGRIGMERIALTGESGGPLGSMAEVCLAVPSKRTARIQEIHGLCLHALAEAIEKRLSLS